jgi:murein L,D-transpeptidase YcbB/YkuD
MFIRCLVALGLATTAILTSSAGAQETTPEPGSRPQTTTAQERYVPEPAPVETAKPAVVPEPTATAPKEASEQPITEPEPTTAAPAKPAEPPPAASESAPPAPVEAAKPAPRDPVGIALEQRLASSPASSDDTAREDLAVLAAYYAEHGYAPLWVSAGGMTPKAAAAIAEIKKADDWGLEASAFALPEPVSGTAPDALAAAEATLSAAVLKYARHARGGRIMDPASDLSSYLDRKPQLLDARDVMEKVAATAAPDAYLRGLHPQHPQFEKLRQQYLKLRDAAAVADVVRLPNGPLLKPGISHPHVAILRKRLEVAPPETPADASLYDEKLQAAVMAYQTEKGLAPDGLVGAGTRAALNDVEVLGPEKLAANMEQWRWMPDDMGDLYVWANVPEFTLRVVKNGEVIHTERVIAGLVDKQTPVFSENLKTIITRPRWNVPNSIKVNELYPSLARGGTNFERQGLRLTQNGRRIDPESVDWSSADIRRYDVYQPPGESNVLGEIKFAFPNKHLVYMHDTPTKRLFEQTSRPFSHGCMRVRNPRRLAEILLGEDKGWDAAKVDGVIENGPENNEIQVERVIPVHVTYFTAWVDEKGETQMARDVYGHEKRITQALAGQWTQIAKGPNHLAPVQLNRVEDGLFTWSWGGTGKRGKAPKTVGDYVLQVLGGGF